VSKRARYDGPYPAVRVTWPPGETVHTEDWYEETVELNHQLSADAPAALRDELTSRPDWTEVEQAEPKSSPKKEDED
jgi:hypothetical protein